VVLPTEGWSNLSGDSPCRLLIQTNFLAAGSCIQKNKFLWIQISHSTQVVSFSVLLKFVIHIQGNFVPEFYSSNLKKEATYVKKSLWSRTYSIYLRFRIIIFTWCWFFKLFFSQKKSFVFFIQHEAVVLACRRRERSGFSVSGQTNDDHNSSHNNRSR
jgi:hypothetical protein